MRACVNRNECIGCQFCTDIAPDVFQMDGTTAACVGAITDSNKDSVSEAAEGCPVGAITTEL